MLFTSFYFYLNYCPVNEKYKNTFTECEENEGPSSNLEVPLDAKEGAQCFPISGMLSFMTPADFFVLCMLLLCSLLTENLHTVSTMSAGWVVLSLVYMKIVSFRDKHIYCS